MPFLSLETNFGLSYRWYRTTGRVLVVYPNDREPEVRDVSGRDHFFEDYGPYNLTSDLTIILWF